MKFVIIAWLKKKEKKKEKNTLKYLKRDQKRMHGNGEKLVKNKK